MIQVEHEPRQIALSAILMVATGLVQAAGMGLAGDLLDRGTEWVLERATWLRQMAMMSGMMTYLFTLHVLEMAVWASVYWFVLSPASFPVALYESAICFTTLDVPDLPLGWRFLPAAESLTGMLMFAWSTGALISAFSTLSKVRREFRRAARARRGLGPAPG